MKSPIIISSPELDRPGEARQVKALLWEGLEVFHVRKPGMSLDEMRMYLDSYTAEETRHMVLHSHHELHLEYPLRGLHGSGQGGAPGSGLPALDPVGFTGTRSCSTHSPEAFAALPDELDYAFLGPVFPSLSKPGYGPENPDSWEWRLLEKPFLQHAAKCIALGGVREANLDRLRQWGFDGFAVLGFIWNEVLENPVSQYKLLEKKWNQVFAN